MSEKYSKNVRKMLNIEWTIVLFRNDRLGIVMDNERNGDLRIFGCNNSNLIYSNGITRVKDYDENLYFRPGDDFDNFHREYDIMAMSCTYITPLGLKRILLGLKDPSEIYWDWKREEVKEVTMADIEDAFGCKVKIVKEKKNE